MEAQEHDLQRHVFHAEGRGYVEVTSDDVGVRWERQEDRAVNETSHGFAKQLEEYVGPCHWDGSATGSEVGWYSCGGELDVKILACVLE